MLNYSRLFIINLYFIIVILILYMIIFNFFNINLLNFNLLKLDYSVIQNYYFFTIIYISILITLFLIIILNKSIIKKNPTVLLIFLIFATIIYILIYTNSIFIYFLMYEFLLLITSVILYYSSQNIRSKIITVYFILWTQLSSLLLWLAIVIIYTNTGLFMFSTLTLLALDNQNLKIVSFLLIVGFSIKLPLWPFSFWLIKTHVESNTSFSIFLSGVLVKTALIGLLKFNIFFINTPNNLLLILITISLLFTSLAIGNQVDFKKLIAYTTVQEMSLILYFITFNGYINNNIILYLIIFHTFMSILLFLINESIYKRFKSRKTQLFLGLAIITPKLNIVLIIIWLLFTSLPLSFKFIFELIILFKFFSLPNLILITLIISLQLLTVIHFTSLVIPYSFGNIKKITFDLTKTELIIFILVFFLIIILVI